MDQALADPASLKAQSEAELIDLMGKARAENLKWRVIKMYGLLGTRDLSERARRAVEDLMVEIVRDLSLRITARSSRKTYTRQCPYTPAAEELDLEATLDNLAGKRVLEYQDLVCLERLTKKDAVAVMMDISGSMSREKIVLTAICAAVLMNKYARGYFALVVFSETPQVIKALEAPGETTEIIREFLNLPVGGVTDLASALGEGLRQLERAGRDGAPGRRIGMLITDGWNTAGGDALKVGGEFDQLNVLQVGVGGGSQNSIDLCKDLARASGGVYSFLESYDELPQALAETVA